MIQQLLIQNERINSVPEPWFMLTLVSLYKNLGFTGGYNQSYASINFLEYLSNVGMKVNDVKEEVRSLSFKLYNLKALPNNHYFLDKTPRYYYIIEELIDLFPNAKFILLYRNPLSTIASILNYHWANNVPRKLSEKSKGDLITSYKNIIKLKSQSLSNVYFLKYEDVIANCKSELVNLFLFLNLKIDQVNEQYELNDNFKKTKFIDKKSVHKHSKVVSAYLNEWERIIDNSSKKSLVIYYLRMLESMRIELLGYDIKVLVQRLKSHKVSNNRIDAVPSYVFGNPTSFFNKVQHRLYLYFH